MKIFEAAGTMLVAVAVIAIIAILLLPTDGKEKGQFKWIIFLFVAACVATVLWIGSC